MAAKFCGGCGTQFAPDVLFCTSCGWKRAEDLSSDNPDGSYKSDILARTLPAIVSSSGSLPVVSSATASLWCNECKSDDHVVRASGIVASSTSYGTIEGVVKGQSTTRTTGTISPRNRTGMYDRGSQINETNTTASSFALNANSRETTALALRIDAVKPKPPVGEAPVSPDPPRGWLYFWVAVGLALVFDVLFSQFFSNILVSETPSILVVIGSIPVLFSWLLYSASKANYMRDKHIYYQEIDLFELIKEEYEHELAETDWASLCYCTKHDQLYVHHIDGFWSTV